MGLANYRGHCFIHGHLPCKLTEEIQARIKDRGDRGLRSVRAREQLEHQRVSGMYSSAGRDYITRAEVIIVA